MWQIAFREPQNIPMRHGAWQVCCKFKHKRLSLARCSRFTSRALSFDQLPGETCGIAESVWMMLGLFNGSWSQINFSQTPNPWPNSHHLVYTRSSKQSKVWRLPKPPEQCLLNKLLVGATFYGTKCSIPHLTPIRWSCVGLGKKADAQLLQHDRFLKNLFHYLAIKLKILID